ncbi:MAG TPA: hypothetical protein VEB22_08680, partial [Phycisphaerales bacterium]|nr:hypothetical protein [Phycisphaerales bacterium]
MNRFLTVAAGLALSVTTLVSTAKALPPIMDRVPANAAIVVVIPSIEGLEKDMNSVLQLVGQPPMVRADDLLSGSGMEGLSKKGSLALVVLESPDIESGEEPPMVAIFQADDYAAFTKGMTTSKDGELDKGVVNGEDVWMKSIGGNYVVAGPKKEHVSAFDGKGGGGERHKKFYGSRADRMTDKADVAVFFDVARLKPLVDQGMAGVEQQMADLAAMTGNPGNAESFKWVKEHIIADTTAGAASLSIDAQGVSLDFACVAKEGSAFAKALDTTGKAHSLLGKLPGGPYLFAYAMDMSNKNWRELFKSMPQAEGADGMGALGALAGSDPEALKDATGMSMVIGVPPGGIMSGVLTRATG